MEELNVIITYDYHGSNNGVVLRKTYRPKDRSDYDRVMQIFIDKPDEYKVVPVDYGF